MIFLVPIYTLLIRLYATLVRVASLFNPKAKLFVRGRKGLLKKIKYDLVDEHRQRIWIHCASLGEFEQGRPVIEALKKKYNNYAFVLTFFSPSGYEIRKNYQGVDYVFYLPLDTPRNARKFIDTVQPSLVLFIKYEFWYFTLMRIAKKDIPILLVSAIFRKSQPFFKWYGTLNRNMIKVFHHVFVQDEQSVQLLNNIGVDNVSVGGDTRFDRVHTVGQEDVNIQELSSFANNAKVIVAGSTWPEDEELLKGAIGSLPSSWKIIIAPHEIDNEHINNIRSLFNEKLTLWSDNKKDLEDERVLVIDKIGLLSKLYRYADVTYVGGGFNTSGIHNVLEAAVYGKPIFHGPNFKKFKEAKALVELNAAFSIKKSNEITSKIQSWESNEEAYNVVCKTAKTYVENNIGATQKVVDYLEEKKLLSIL